MAEEFNKYLSYVRNLGFEDTPDYDYLRELFTQALKNTGEVEDGEYDWMKLNNGRGWEAMKHHPSQHLHAANALPNPSARALGGGADTPRGPGTPGISRLNAAQPLPPSPAKPGAGKTRDRPSAAGAALPKRQSAAAGGLTDLAGTPAGSTAAQFQQSTTNLGTHNNNNRMSTVNPVGAMAQNGTAQGQHQSGGRGPGNQDQEASGIQKLMKVMCCSR